MYSYFLNNILNKNFVLSLILFVRYWVGVFWLFFFCCARNFHLYTFFGPVHYLWAMLWRAQLTLVDQLFFLASLNLSINFFLAFSKVRSRASVSLRYSTSLSLVSWGIPADSIIMNSRIKSAPWDLIIMYACSQILWNLPTIIKLNKCGIIVMVY